MKRIGILGGTFDPPHIGHLIVAQDAWRALELERVLFIPAAVPPHKRGRVATPPDLRLALTRAAIEGDARFEVSDIELLRPGPSYTVDTLRELRVSAPECALFLLMGADQFQQFHTWREPESIAEMAELVVLARGGEDAAVGSGRVPHRRLPVTRIDVSATDVRRRVAAREPIRYLVPAGVEAIIGERGLYR